MSATTNMLEEVFGAAKPVIGVIHLLPLPGSPNWDGQMEPMLLRAEQEAASLASGGAHGIIIENFFDAPFAKNHVDTATACAITLAAKRVMSVCHLPIGINVLRNDGMTALAVAATVGAKFIRVNVFTGAMLTDQGLIEGQAHELLNYRRHLASKSIKIFADVMVKHASPVTPLADIGQMAAEAAYRGHADALIVSGVATGSAPAITSVTSVREAVADKPLLIGSGANRENAATLLAPADGVIVGSSLKRQGKIENPIDVERVRSFVNATNRQPAQQS